MQLVRILVYEGTPKFIADNLANRGVKNSMTLSNGNKITEAILGDLSDLLRHAISEEGE